MVFLRRKVMLKYILKRIGLMLVTLWIIITATFFLMNSMPGNPITAQVKRLPDAVVQRLEQKYGFDKPVTQRYVLYMKNVLKGDMGDSITSPGIDTNQKIRDHFPNSARLGVQAVAFGLTIGLIFGVVAGFKKNSPVDYLVMFLAILGVSIPGFVLATLVQSALGGKGIIPIAGWYDDFTPAGQGFKYTILPTIALSFGSIATYARYMRASVLDVISQDYILTARAKGLSNRAIAIKHILRNAILPVVTILGPQIATIVTGTIVIERIFNIPGLGNSMVESIYARDYNIILGLTIFFSALYVLSLLVVDIAYCIVDPRIKLEGNK
jgi:oligopeptide transport system permease protein